MGDYENSSDLVKFFGGNLRLIAVTLFSCFWMHNRKVIRHVQRKNIMKRELSFIGTLRDAHRLIKMCTSYHPINLDVNDNDDEDKEDLIGKKIIIWCEHHTTFLIL